MNTIDPTAADPLTPLRARTALPDAVATDWFALGNALLQRANGDKALLREAVDALMRAHRLDANCDARLLHGIAQTAFILRDWALIESSTALLLARDANDANALVWRAAAVQERDDFTEAQRLLQEAARAAPGNHVVLHKLALCIKEQGRFGEAEALLRRVLELTPDNAHALFDLSELEVRAGRYAQGWLDYEARIAFAHDSNAARAALAAICPNWRGESLAGKTLVVYGEQGNGDCLWSVRFLPLLAERAQREGGRVIFGYAGPMQHLFERMLPDGIKIETSLDTKPDYHCGLMSLPLR
ncbi:MAG: tetratricopeptide repeat protein, partial [Paraburkholderia hospita]